MSYNDRNIVLKPQIGDAGTYNISVYLTDNGIPPMTTQNYFIITVLKNTVATSNKTNTTTNTFNQTNGTTTNNA